MKYNLLLICVVLLCISCGQDYVPKPKAYLRLDYPAPKYQTLDINAPFSFETNILATDVKLKKLPAKHESYGVNIEYPSLKGTIFLTYKAVNNSDTTLKQYLRDAEKLTLEHMIKADEVPPMFPFKNELEKVYGVFSEVRGNVASPAQFYVTDSVNHFLTGSLYFYAKPNYDSILPAANYMQKDIKHIMETLKWK
ncbi:gliding motility lipoprotein GldD [Aestuariibaculum sediminum]|uniref:Gliding motility lipoprotein GldD n=1 Tax=Aestuariibaculum sediminum TaxID=2770637 RepID=A0A8J6PYA4_9FLAO|nr:gliding motility lipoprotein GldD [Aestuariibaculum sediminum]MBD0830992.1 gliding motility lipoprotein GldD [Aestuariibaculum sediminum]